MEVPVEARRDQQIVLFTLPLVSGLLSPEASVHLDLRWGTFALYCSLFIVTARMKNKPGRHFHEYMRHAQLEGRPESQPCNLWGHAQTL